ncbi:hypothetical protein [Caballeronia glebae]|uniref:hypothetical protein n=1 Tax=Caballeronia glebae TaxID=1777143 RepID=UPI0038B86310
MNIRKLLSAVGFIGACLIFFAFVTAATGIWDSIAAGTIHLGNRISVGRTVSYAREPFEFAFAVGGLALVELFFSGVLVALIALLIESAVD